MDVALPEENEDFKIPALNPLIKLFKASPDREGKPRWSLYHPASNKYFYINWTEFECIARFHKHVSARDLQNDLNKNTTLDVDLDDIKSLVVFLHTNSLLSLDQQAPAEIAKDKPLWERIVHGYLFFTLPLFKPTAFLKTSLPFIRPLLTKTFIWAMLIILAIGVILTIQRLDEFTHTFLEMFSVKGAIITFFVFTGIKIIHELSHAYIATKHGVSVPHMGVALIVMYPVLYTETTGAWRLSSARKRIEIGLAGIMAELALAAIFLMLWHVLPPGMGKSIAFSVVAISLIGSLFVNLNPLMRFDGYFVLSDMLNIENLHARAIALARWKIRRLLFGLTDAPPECFAPSLQRFMILFGLSIIIYRFFLFLGIALLVYFVFFKPLGLILMILELVWFIGAPMMSELKIWWKRKGDILKQKRAWLSGAVATTIIIFSLLPFQTNISVPGVLHAQQHRSVHAPSSAFIKSLNVEDGQKVSEGDVLAVLVSDALEKDIKVAQAILKTLNTQIKREKRDIERYRVTGTQLESDLRTAQQQFDALKAKTTRLIVKAPFDGVIRDLSPEIHANRYVSSDHLLLRVIEQNAENLTVYIGEGQLQRIAVGNKAFFYPDHSVFSKKELTVTSIDPVNIKTLSRPELASVYGGDIPSAMENGEVKSLEPLYKTHLKPLKNINNSNKSTVIETGHIRIKAIRESALLSTFRNFIALIIRESGLN